MNFYYNANKAFEECYIMLQKYGTYVKNTRAFFNTSMCLVKPMDNEIKNPGRKWSKSYADREWDWYLSGDPSVAEIKKHAPMWDRMHNGNNLVWSNYGYWWQRNLQLKKIINLLKEDPETRRAVIVHYSPDELDNFTHDTPCNLVLNFYIFEKKLHLTVFARSIDIWFGFCNDQYIFSKLMKLVADELQIEVGLLNFHITNLHLYENQTGRQI